MSHAHTMATHSPPPALLVPHTHLLVAKGVLQLVLVHQHLAVRGPHDAPRHHALAQLGQHELVLAPAARAVHVAQQLLLHPSELGLAPAAAAGQGLRGLMTGAGKEG